MEILAVRALHGPNVWARVAMLEARIDCRTGQPLTPVALATFHQRLTARLPGWTPRDPRERASGDAGNDASCQALAATLGDVTLHLQNRACELADTLLNVTLPSGAQTRAPLALALTGRCEPSGICPVAIAYEEETFGRACLEAACRFCGAALAGAEFDTEAEVGRLAALAEEECLGNVSAALVAAARARGIPFRRLDRESLVQLGWGAQQQRVRKSFTSRTGKIAEWISCNKQFIKTLLHELGIPVPAGRLAVSEEDAWDAACEIGLPVVIKPVGSDNTYGVNLRLTTRERVSAAYAVARAYGEQVIVERFISGEQYRILVVGDRMVAANWREPPRVVGDGQRSIAELIALANRDPCRGDRSDKYTWDYISQAEDTLDLLAEQGFDFDSIPPAGRQVVLGRFGHLKSGARVIDVTDAVHPQVAAQCVSAVRLLGLDVAGLDVIAEDISRPLEDQGGTILEVNAEPWLVFHLLPPYCVPPRPVCEAVIESLFPEGQTGRIPVAAIIGRGDNVTCGRWLTHLLQGLGHRVGWASGAGLYLNDRRLKSGDQANRAGGQALLLCPEVEAAVLERSLDSIRREGLGWDLCDVAIVTRLGPPASSAAGPADGEPEQISAARVVAESVRPHGAMVVLADDPAAGALTAAHRGPLFLVTDRAEHPAVAGSGRRGHHAVYRRENDVVLAAPDGPEQRIAVDWQRGPGADQDPAAEGLLAAVAAAWAMQVPLETLRARLAPAV